MATYDFNTSTPSGVTDRSTQRSLLSKTFLYMFAFLAITVAVTVGTSLILRACGLKVEGEYITVPDNVAKAYFITMLSAGIAQIILTIVIAFTSLKRGKAAVVPIVLYAVCMGILISSFALFLPWWVLASTFGIACLCFAAMAILGLTIKRATGLAIVGFGLLFGVMMASLFNIFIFVFARELWNGVILATSLIIVVAIMLITAYDVYNIKQISARCTPDGNLAFFLAFNLYLDFIIILIHLLRLVAIVTSNSRR